MTSNQCGVLFSDIDLRSFVYHIVHGHPEFAVFFHFLKNLPIWNFRIYLYILYISLFGISDFSIKFQEFPSLFNHFPYLEKKISLFVFSDVSHVCLLYSNYLQAMRTCIKAWMNSKFGQFLPLVSMATDSVII